MEKILIIHLIKNIFVKVWFEYQRCFGTDDLVKIIWKKEQTESGQLSACFVFW